MNETNILPESVPVQEQVQIGAAQVNPTHVSEGGFGYVVNNSSSTSGGYTFVYPVSEPVGLTEGNLAETRVFVGEEDGLVETSESDVVRLESEKVVSVEEAVIESTQDEQLVTLQTESVSSIGYTDDQLESLHYLVVDELEKRNKDLNFENVSDVTLEILHAHKLDIAEANFEPITTRLLARVLGFGPLSGILDDPTVTEVMVNGPKNIYVERKGQLTREETVFSSDAELLQVINRIVSQVGRRIDTASPLVDARLADGSRVNAIVPPLALTGPTLTIRRFPAKPLTLSNLIELGALSPAMGEFLKACVEAKLNILISGGTGSGKTTLLNSLASCIPPHERVVTIEDAAEMKINLPHLVALESRQSNIEGKGEVAIRQLVKNSLRMRPDRIVVGEIRGGEALDMLQAMNTGHQGSLTTVHANAPLEALYRVETMTLMSDVELPLQAIRAQIKQAVQVVVQQERLSSGRRVVTGVAMLVPNFSDRDASYEMVSVFEFVKTKGVHRATGELPPEMFLFDDAGVEVDLGWFGKSPEVRV